MCDQLCIAGNHWVDINDMSSQEPGTHCQACFDAEVEKEKEEREQKNK